MPVYLDYAPFLAFLFTLSYFSTDHKEYNYISFTLNYADKRHLLDLSQVNEQETYEKPFRLTIFYHLYLCSTPTQLHPSKQKQ